jgi:hypothetical protein
MPAGTWPATTAAGAAGTTHWQWSAAWLCMRCVPAHSPHLQSRWPLSPRDRQKNWSAVHCSTACNSSKKNAWVDSQPCPALLLSHCQATLRHTALDLFYMWQYSFRADVCRAVIYSLLLLQRPAGCPDLTYALHAAAASPPLVMQQQQHAGGACQGCCTA